jgi:S-adenosylmethionine hydrolase
MAGVISITTDFGNVDGFVGVMKGVMLGITHGGTSFVDISNEIAPGDIASGAWILANSFKFFPPGTVHLAIVDPGVGSKRRGVIIRSSDYLFVAPDNGLLSLALESLGAVDCFEIGNPKFWRADVSTTFHGRDIFAPVAAHLAAGKDAKEFGNEIEYSSLIRLPDPRLDIAKSGITGVVRYIDRFGNLITNIDSASLESSRHLVAGGREIPVRESYSSVQSGELLALGGSHGFVEIAMNGGRADSALNAKIGTEVILKFDH